MKIVLAGLICLVSVCFIKAQENLLLNSNADSGFLYWNTQGNATVEEFSGSNQIFVVRNQGSFIQKVKLSNDAADKFILLIGRGASERVNADGVITGLPSLYGYLYSSKSECGGRINTYLTGQKLLGRVRNNTEWVTMYGIFQVPKGTVAAQVFLNQAERKDFPQNGSAAKFDNVGLYLFENENEALEFVRSYE